MVSSDPVLLSAFICPFLFFIFSPLTHTSFFLLHFFFTFLVCLWFYLPTLSSPTFSSSLLTWLPFSEFNLLSFLLHSSPLYSPPSTSSPNFHPLSRRRITCHFSLFFLPSHLPPPSLSLPSPLVQVRYMFERALWAVVSSLLHNLLRMTFGYKTQNNASQGGKTFWRHSACCFHYKL